MSLPDRFAVLADVHGNVDALAAVLADIDALGVGCIVNLGDHLSGPLAARATADLLIARVPLAIRGNHDRWLLDTPPDVMGPSDRAAHGQLGAGHLAWLAALPATRHWGDVFACHGTPTQDTAYWLETVGADGTVHAAARTQVQGAASGVTASLALCAHTHIARRVDLPGLTVFNPGSVGCPGYADDAPVPHVVQTGSPAASYGLVERRGPGWLTTVRQVPYDPAAMVALARAAGRADWAGAVGTGWMG